MDHSHRTHNAANHDRCDRDQQSAQSKESINEFVHASPFRHAAIPNRFSGGADRDRTGGLLVANQALSQLSYSPTTTGFNVARFQCCKVKNLETLKLWHLETLILVGLDRLELSTSPLSGVRSSHLSYRPGPASTSPEPCTLLYFSTYFRSFRLQLLAASF
jgi:hypothetical protein